MAANAHPVDGDKIKRLRTQKCLTVEELAEKAKVSKRTIESYEKGGRAYLELIRSLANALEVSPESLLLGFVPSDPPKERRIAVKIELSIPFEEFDQSQQIRLFIELLKQLLDGNVISPISVGPGSTVITVELTERQLMMLIHRQAEKSSEVTPFPPKDDQRLLNGLEYLCSSSMQASEVTRRGDLRMLYRELRQIHEELNALFYYLKDYTARASALTNAINAVTLPDDDAVPLELRGKTVPIRINIADV